MEQAAKIFCQELQPKDVFVAEMSATRSRISVRGASFVWYTLFGPVPLITGGLHENLSAN